MVTRGSNRPDVIKLGELIKEYFSNKDNFMARDKLKNITKINCEDLVDALDNINLEIEIEPYKKLKEDYEDLKANYEGVHKYYEQQDEDQKKLIEALESILENPLIVQFTKKINNLTELLKEVKYP
jgi:hypothetical protein